MDQIVGMCLIFEKNPTFFLKWLYHFIFPPAVYENSGPVPPAAPLTLFMVSTLPLFKILMGICYLIVVLICISLLTNNI